MSFPDPLVGRVIAERYEILSCLTAGGAGAVYRAKHRSLERPVALKLIPPELVTSEATVQRFMDEARAVSRMNHPHVVSVLDFGRVPAAAGGYLFLVTEMLSGPDLASVLIRERPLPLPRAANITIQTLEALAEAHHLGIVHRDVKPANIVLEPTRTGHDHVKVIDFAIAAIGAARSAEEATDPPIYTAPELVNGEAGPAADIYSTGVMLFEMLTGGLPADSAAAPGSLPPASLDPRKAAPRRGISDALAAACLRAMDPDPARRFPDAQTFANAIRAAISGFKGSDVQRVRQRPAPPIPPRPAPSTPPPISSRSADGPGSRPGGPASTRRAGGPALVGREDDLAWAFDLLAAAKPPPAIAYWGRPGVGKTRLASEVAAGAESEGWLVIPVGLPRQPCDEVGYIGLRHIVRGLCGFSPAELMNERAVSAVDRLSLMGLRMLFSRAKAPADAITARRTAAAALAWAMRRAADRAEHRRVLLVIDDVDRLDAASLLALRDRLQSEPIPGVTLLVTSQHARTVVLLSGVRERALRGLSREDAIRMLATLREGAGLPRYDDDIEPLYVAQIAALEPAAAAEAPATLDDIVAWRAQALPAPQRRILQALAVVGVQHLENLAILLGRAGDMDAALDALLEADWIERRGGHISLRYGSYGAAAITGAPSGAIATLHRAAAHQLRDTRQLVELRAHHAIHGGADFESFVLLEEVARLRSARGDHDGAIAALSAAVAAAREQVKVGETEAAPAALGVFGRKLAAALVAAERIEEARAVLAEILSVCEPRALTRAAVLEQLATVGDLLGHHGEAEKRRLEALEIAERTDDEKLKDRLRAAVNGAASQRTLGPEPPPAGKPSAPPAQRPVLIVEDDRSIREGLQSVLESEGYSAFGAGNGREALDLLRKIPRPGLILLDLMMPVMSGWEVLEALRTDEEFATVPVVVVSAVPDRTKVTASRVLRKPIEVGRLLGIVEEFCV